MAIQNIAYSARTVMTMTLTSLANAAAWQSLVVDNTTNKYDDVIVFVQTKGQAGSTAGLEFYLYAYDGGTLYSDGATGTDLTFTAANRKNSPLIDVITLNTTTATPALLRRSVAACFGGIMPGKWGLIAINSSGGALSATSGDHVVTYQGITYTVV